MIPHAIPPKYMGVTIDQSTTPATADHPSIAPQLNVRAGCQSQARRYNHRSDIRTEEDLWVICDPFHQWIKGNET
jgi:hypothetical protein